MPPQKPFKDYYAVLGLPRTATDEQIRTAFRRASRKFHPDMGNGDAEKFKAASEAFNALGRGGLNKDERAKYDRGYELQSRRSTSERWQPRTRPSTGRTPQGGETIEEVMSRIQRETDDIFQRIQTDVDRTWGGIMGDFQASKPPRRDEQRRREDIFNILKPDLLIPANDLGFLCALVKAHQSREQGIWKVRKNGSDRREGVKDFVYEVYRDQHGSVGFRRIITDWAYATFEELHSGQRDFVLKMDPRGMVDHLVIKGLDTRGNMFRNEFWHPRLVAQYYNALGILARERGEGRRTTFTEDNLVRQVNPFVRSNPRIFYQEGLSYATMKQEGVRKIPFAKLWEEVGKAEHLVVREGVNRTPEGNFGQGESRG